jgi:hypothetical protein
MITAFEVMALIVAGLATLGFAVWVITIIAIIVMAWLDR